MRRRWLAVGGREGRGAAPVMVAGRERTARAAAPLRPIAPCRDRIGAAPTPLPGPHLGETARRGASRRAAEVPQPSDQNAWPCRALAGSCTCRPRLHAGPACRGWPRPALHHCCGTLQPIQCPGSGSAIPQAPARRLLRQSRPFASRHTSCCTARARSTTHMR